MPICSFVYRENISQQNLRNHLDQLQSLSKPILPSRLGPLLRCRLYLLANKVPFTDELVSLEKWSNSEKQRVKESGEQPAGALRCAARGAAHAMLTSVVRASGVLQRQMKRLALRSKCSAPPQRQGAAMQRRSKRVSGAHRAPASASSRGQVLCGAHSYQPVYWAPGAAISRTTQFLLKMSGQTPASSSCAEPAVRCYTCSMAL